MSYTLTLEPSEFSVTWLPPKPSGGTKADAELKTDRSRSKWGLRALARFLMALCIGIATLLAWQPDSDAARETIASSSLQLGRVAPQGASIAQTASNAIAPTALSPGEQQLEAISLDLAAMRQSIDELIANQERMAREIARLQESARYILYKMSEPPPRPAPDQTRQHGPRPGSKTTGTGPNAHHTATSSRSAGPSLPAPVSLTRQDTHMRTRVSTAGVKSSPEVVPFSQAVKSAWSRITGIRS